MGERGPIARTRPQDDLSGNPNHCRLKTSIPVSESGKVVCPDWLAEDAQLFWARIVPQLEARSMIDVTDYPSLVSLCITWSEVKRYHEFTSSGKASFYKAPGGQIIPHPAVSLLRQAQARLDSIMKQFGLSPASRARLPPFDQAIADSVDQDSDTEVRKG